MGQFNTAFGAVAGGSNLIGGRDDQGMRREIHGPGAIKVGGEWFGYLGAGSRRWAQGMPAATGAETGRGIPGGFTTANLRAALEGAPAITGDLGATRGPEQQQRPYYYGGVVDVGGQKFRFGTGGGGAGSLPYGTYALTSTIGSWGQTHGAVAGISGTGNVGNSVYDPKTGHTFVGVEVHPNSSTDLERLYTAGCFSVSRTEWPRFKQALLDAAAKAPGGRLFLRVTPGGASIGPRGVSAEEPSRPAGSGATQALMSTETTPGFAPGPSDLPDVRGMTWKQKVAAMRKYLDRPPAGGGEIDRSTIDAISARRMRHRAIGSANIDVNVKSEGQKSVSQIGPFRKVRIARAVQMHKAETGPAEPVAATGGGEE
jgi:hypothetical protein